MPSRIRIVYGIVVAISVEIQSVRRIGVEVFGAVERNESAQGRVIIPCVKVIKIGFFVVIVAAVTNGVIFYNVFSYTVGYRAISPSVVGVLFPILS